MSKGKGDGKRRKFKVEFQVEVEIEVDQEVLDDAQSAEFRKDFYAFDDDAAVAHHLAYNFVANRASLDSLDGFAHWRKDNAKKVDESWDMASVTEIEE